MQKCCFLSLNHVLCVTLFSTSDLGRNGSRGGGGSRDWDICLLYAYCLKHVCLNMLIKMSVSS